MARNIEIKARIQNLEAFTAALTAISSQAAETPEASAQDDTFFKCDQGRLKLRAFVNGTGQLIFYRRENQPGPKESFYCLSLTDHADTLRETLSLAYGQTGRVRKMRTLVKAGRTRIHVDTVEGLGNFLELEVVLAPDEENAVGVAEADAIMAQLGIRTEDLIAEAYVDLLAQ